MNTDSVVVNASPAGSPRSYWLWAVAAAHIVGLVEQCAAEVPMIRSAS